MKEEFRCPHCKSSQTRIRVRTSDRICYVCGETWSVKEQNTEEEIDG